MLGRKHQTLSEKEIVITHARLIESIEVRVKGRYTSGAHSEEELGEFYTDYYSMEAWRKLDEGKWTLKEGRTVYEQLEIIAGNLISKQVEKYKRKQRRRDSGREVTTTYMAPEEIDNLTNDQTLNHDPAYYKKRLEIVKQAIDGDEELTLLYSLLRDGKKYDDLINFHEKWTDKATLYRLKEKLIRRCKKLQKGLSKTNHPHRQIPEYNAAHKQQNNP